MKKFTCCFIAMISFSVTWGQLSKLTGTWISKDQECLLIQDTLNQRLNSYKGDIFKSPYGNILGNKQSDQSYKIFLLHDTLSFQREYTEYYHSPDLKKYWQKDFADRFNFQITSITDTELVVKTASAQAKTFAGGKQIINFKKQEFAIDKTITFQSLQFRTPRTGNTPSFLLYLDSAKRFYLRTEKLPGLNVKSDISKDVQVFTTLNDSLYNDILNTVRSCNISTLEFPASYCCSGSLISLNICYNDTERSFSSETWPVIAHPLLKKLYSICEIMIRMK